MNSRLASLRPSLLSTLNAGAAADPALGAATLSENTTELKVIGRVESLPISFKK